MLLQYIFCQVLRSTIVRLLCLLNTKYIVAVYFLSDAIAKALQCGWTLDLLWVWFLTKYASFASNNSCSATEHQLFYRSDRLAGWAALGWPLYNNPATSLLFCYEYWPVSTSLHRNCLSSWPISHQTTTTYLRKCILQVMTTLSCLCTTGSINIAQCAFLLNKARLIHKADRLSLISISVLIWSWIKFSDWKRKSSPLKYFLSLLFDSNNWIYLAGLGSTLKTLKASNSFKWN